MSAGNPEERHVTDDRRRLLRLMRGASENFVTARATIREWRDEKTVDEVRERIAETEAYRRIFGPPEQRGGGLREDRGEFERTWRVWHEKPNRWRQEIEPSDGSGTEYRVVDGDDFWAYSPRFGPRHAVARRSEYGGGFGPEFEISHVFDPGVSHLELDALELRSVGRTRLAGREAIRVQGVKPGGWDRPPEPMWWGADDYEIVVDVERGVILSLASRLQGRAFDVTEVLDIGFDETFQRGTFALRLPGVRFDTTDWLT